MATLPNVMSFGLPPTDPDTAENQLRRAGLTGSAQTLPELPKTYATVSTCWGGSSSSWAWARC
ncbi:MAG: hypothetical protein IPK19_21570 [Chloroflexi bacterium]|nr:hypothetical protein [Chloroflexota bacterium]